MAEQLVPPLSGLTAATVLTFLLTTVLRARGARRLAAAVLLGQGAYIVTGLRLAHVGRRGYAALLWAPLYVVWKIGVYARAAIGIRDSRWIRTARPQKVMSEPR